MKLKKVMATVLVSALMLSSTAIYSPTAYAATMGEVAGNVGMTESELNASLRMLNGMGVVSREDVGDLKDVFGDKVITNINAVLAAMDAINGAGVTKDGSTFILNGNASLPSNLSAGERAAAEQLLAGFKGGLDTGSSSSTIESLLKKYGANVGSAATPTPKPTTPTTPTSPTTSTAAPATQAPVTSAAPAASAIPAPVVTKNTVDIVLTPNISEKALDTLVKLISASETLGKQAAVEFKAEMKDGKSEIAVPSTIANTLFQKTNADVKISTSIATLTFDHASLGAIIGEAKNTTAKKTDIKFGIDVVKPSEIKGLSESSAAAVSDRPVYDFNVTANGKKVSDFKGGKVDVSVPYKLGKDEVASAVVVYYIADSGKLVPVKSSFKDGNVKMSLSHFSKYVVAYNPVTYKDVASDNKYFNAITFGAAQTYLDSNGMGEGMYQPTAAVTRAMLLVTVMNAFGIQPDKDLKANYEDVTADSSYAGYAAAAKRLKLMNNVVIDGEAFEAEKVMTSEEMYTVVYNVSKYAGAILDKQTVGEILYKDFYNVAAGSRRAVVILVSEGAIAGTGMLYPKAEATRGEMANVIYNLLTK